jgi:hypothetical protein
MKCWKDVGSCAPNTPSPGGSVWRSALKRKARDAEILVGAGYLYTEKTFPGAFELFEICRTFGSLPVTARCEQLDPARLGDQFQITRGE